MQTLLFATGLALFLLGLFTGFAASQPKAAEAEPSPPLNPGIVVIGALLGAALGALGLLVRRGR